MNNHNSLSVEIQHVTRFEYERPISRATILLRLKPRSDSHQNVIHFEYEIEPHAVPVAVNDSFGNICHLLDFQWINQSSITLKSTADVQTHYSPPALEKLDQVSWEVLKEKISQFEHWEFLQPSERVYECLPLQDFLIDNKLGPNNTPHSALTAAAKSIYQNLRFEPGSTEVNSKIEDSLEQGSGVCQDFTHIMLAIGRSWGIPSRYVSGYFQLNPENEEGVASTASHAWSEFYFPGIGWVGFDATNDTVVDHRYIRVSVGRDYDDVAPTRGVVFGGGTSTLNVNVTLAHKLSSFLENPPPITDQ